jgi:hypothetical protein
MVCLVHYVTKLTTPLLKRLIVRPASQDVSCLLWNQEVHCHVHRCWPFVPILSQIKPIHTFQPYFSKTHFNIIFPFMPRSSEWHLQFRPSNRNLVCISHLPPAHYMPHPSDSSSFDHSNMWWKVRIMELLIMQFSPFSCHLIPLRPKCYYQ